MISLPIDAEISKIKSLIERHQTLILMAEPGAGKTTRVPPAIADIFQKKILVLEPRRLATVAAATRISEEQGWNLGERIGYQVRFESRFQSATQIIFMTEALLMRRLMIDPRLSDVDCVVLDEFHERSLHTDVSLGALRELQELERPDLKLIIMSATLDSEPLKKFCIDAVDCKVPGKTFPLQDHFDSQSQSLNTDHRFVERVVEKIKSPEILNRGNVLVFLPGVSELERVFQAAASSPALSQFEKFQLHGNLQLADQQSVLKPSSKKKLIFATNIAESSLTIDGVDTVVDSGLARVPVFYPHSQVASLETKRISLWNSKQRAGRAHRQKEGAYFRLWSKIDERSMSEQPEPEILRTDLSETFLMLARLGIVDVSRFAWLTPPKTESLQAALAALRAMQLLTSEAKVTELGKRVAALPLPPRLGCLFENCRARGAEKMGANLCALLSEPPRISNRLGSSTNTTLTHQESDLKKHLADFLGSKSPQAPRWRKISEQLSNKKMGDQDLEILDDVLMESFGDQICKRRQPESLSALRVDGKGVSLSETTDVIKSDFFVALQLIDRGKADLMVNMAHGLPLHKIETHFRTKIKDSSQLILNPSRMELQIQLCSSLGRMPLGNIRYRTPQPSEVEDQLPQLVLENWDFVLKKNEALLKWWSRLDYYCHECNLETPFKQAALLEAAKNACFGEHSFQKVSEKDWIYFLSEQMPSGFESKWKKACPAQLKSPSGREFAIHYEASKAPYVEIKIQHAFGITKNIPILDGKYLLNFHLLAPNGRPAQMTSDIEGFWRNSYPEIRKELKGRYPKHDWPEF